MSHNDEQLRVDWKLRLYASHGILLARALCHQTALHSIAHVLHEAQGHCQLLRRRARPDRARWPVFVKSIPNNLRQPENLLGGAYELVGRAE